MRASPSPRRRDPSGASRVEGRGWALTQVPPRPIPPAGHVDRPPEVARCRARHAARRYRDPRSPCPSRRPGHAQCARRGSRPARPAQESARRCRKPMSVSSSSHSPVWIPARISMPSVSASTRNASAQRMAWVGPSNVARWPSPVSHHRAAEAFCEFGCDLTEALQHRPPPLVARRRGVLRRGGNHVGRIGRTSIRNPASNVALAIPGLALMRSNIPSWRIDRTDGRGPLSAAPLPHPKRTARPNSCRRAICSGRRRVVLTELAVGWRARSSAGSRSKSIPAAAIARVRAGGGSTPAFAPVVLRRRRWTAGPPSLRRRGRRLFRSRRRP